MPPPDPGRVYIFGPSYLSLKHTHQILQHEFIASIQILLDFLQNAGTPPLLALLDVSI